MQSSIISGLFIAMTAINIQASSLSDSQFTKQTQYVSNDTYSGIPVMGAWQHATGKGVVIAVIDTGIAEHADLNLAPGFDMVSYFSEADLGNDGDGGRDSDPTDNGENGNHFQWHGLSVAGVAAAKGESIDGIKGVAYNATILPIRAMGKCSTITINGKTGQTCFAIEDIIDSIYWATGNKKDDGSKWVINAPINTNPAKVINISLTARGACDQRLQAAVDFAISKNITVVAA
jgi:serine protease